MGNFGEQISLNILCDVGTVDRTCHGLTKSFLVSGSDFELFDIQNPLHPINLDSDMSHPDSPQDSKEALRLISWDELSRHNTRESCWVLIDGEVYDATDIIDTHPGGVGPLMKQAGKDAT